MSRLAHLVLTAYPPSFRARYGDELSALVQELPANRSTTTDLVRGAATAWLRPSFGGTDGPRRRLQATLATTWVAWCAGFLIAPAVNRALLDPPVPGATRGVRTLLDAGYVLFFLGWALALLGAAPVVLRALVPAVRSRRWTALRPLVPAVVLGLLEAIGLVALAVTRTGDPSHPSAIAITCAVIWLVGFAAFVVSLGIGPAVSLARVGATTTTLRSSAFVTLPLALALVALTGCSLAAVARSGDAALVGSGVPVTLALAVACVASLVALVSSGRGLRAVRAS